MILTKIVVHPLFLLVGIFTAFTGDLLIFLTATVAALEHELAHAIAAHRAGFSLDKIVLMPYGAVISGDITGISRRQELVVCAAGPLANAVTAALFIALWWLFPETYPYTDAAANVSLSLFAVNLLPAYPLDGGRILNLLLQPIGKKRARRICAAVSFATAAGVLGYFIYTCFSQPEWSALVFAGLLAAGVFGGGNYRRISFSRKKSLRRGVEELRIVISAENTVGYAVRFLREDRYLVLVLYEGDRFYGELTEEEFLAGVNAGQYDRALKTLLTPL